MLCVGENTRRELQYLGEKEPVGVEFTRDFNCPRRLSSFGMGVGVDRLVKNSLHCHEAHPQVFDEGQAGLISHISVRGDMIITDLHEILSAREQRDPVAAKVGYV